MSQIDALMPVLVMPIVNIVVIGFSEGVHERQKSQERVTTIF